MKKKEVVSWAIAVLGAVIIGIGIGFLFTNTVAQQPEVYDWKTDEDTGQNNIEIDTSEGYPETQNGDASGSGVVSDDQVSDDDVE